MLHPAPNRKSSLGSDYSFGVVRDARNEDPLLRVSMFLTSMQPSASATIPSEASWENYSSVLSSQLP